MKKATYLAAVLLAITSTSWAAPQCVPWDYARIKDAKEDELVELSCSSHKKMMDNYAETLQIIASDSLNRRSESEDAMHAQEVCRDQTKQADKMLREKFHTRAKCSPQ
jgi:hypothetical protein